MVYIDSRAVHPLVHRMELFSSAKFIFVRMNHITSEFFLHFSRRFSGPVFKFANVIPYFLVANNCVAAFGVVQGMSQTEPLCVWAIEWRFFWIPTICEAETVSKFKFN